MDATTIAPAQASTSAEAMPTDVTFTSDPAAEAAPGALHPPLAEFGVREETPQQAVKRLVAVGGLTQEQVARECGVSGSTLSAWLNGSYRGDNARVERDVRAWLRARDDRAQATAVVPRAPEYFAGPSAQILWGVLQYAHAHGRMAMGVTAPGIGKTSVAREYRRQHPNVWIATMTSARAGVVPALQRVCAAVGLRASGGAATLEDALLERLVDTRGLLVVDEGQHLSVAALDAIRALHDAVGVGIALLGNEGLAEVVRGARRAERTAQLTSRVAYRKYVTRISAKDVAAQLDAWRVAGRPEREYLAGVAAQPGALRNVAMTLELAHRTAGEAGEPLARAHLERAWRELGASQPVPVA